MAEEKDPNIQRIEARMMHIVNAIDKLAADIKANHKIALHEMDPSVLASWCSTMILVGEKARDIVEYQAAKAAAILLVQAIDEHETALRAAQAARDN